MNKFVKLIPNLFIFIGIVFFNLHINAQEIVFLHTNKSDYITGETVQFKAYLLGNTSHQLLNSSAVIYFQLTGYDKIEFSGLRANIENGTCKGQINLSDSLKTGFYYLSAYTNCMLNYPVNTYFNKKIFITNQNDSKLDSIIDYSIVENQDLNNSSTLPKSSQSAICKVSTDKYLYKPGEKIKLNIKLDSSIKASGITSLSVSVSEQSPFEDSASTRDIISHLALINKEWKQLLNDSYTSSYRSFTEKKAHLFKGQLLNKTTQIPINNATVLLSTPDSISNLQYYTTGKDGVFYFQLTRYYDNRLIYLQLNDSNSVNKNYIFKIDDKKIYPPKFLKSILNMNLFEKKYLKNSQKLSLINKIYYPAKHKKDTEPIVKFNMQRIPFFGIPDQTIIPADYEELASFTEMTQNYMGVVKVKKNSDGFKLNMIDYEDKLLQDENALLLVNSIPVFDYKILESLGTLALQRIELKNRHVIYGKLNFHGVVSVLTDQKLAKAIYSDNMIPSFRNDVMVTNSDFLLNADKSKEVQSGKIPDFRQNLYWNPEVIIDEKNESNIEFNASEFKTKYNVEVQGITSDNKLVYSSSTIEVK